MADDDVLPHFDCHPSPDFSTLFPSPHPDSSPSWIHHIESLLMTDDDPILQAHHTVPDDFFADLLLDSPLPPSPDLVHSDVSSVDKDNQNHQVGSSDADNGGEGPDDPLSKKQRRKMRNRDAAVRSRERKKMYVRDLEMKSRYLEGECRRLGRLLQCSVAENQALRLWLQKGGAYDASSAKQESAVLLLESLLLGSLLWFLGIMCLFSLPPWPQSILEAVPLENVGKKDPEKRGVGSNGVVQSFVRSRRCVASKTKMKLGLQPPRALLEDFLRCLFF